MPAFPTTYRERQPEAVAGMVANMRDWDAITRSCESDAIGFGLAVGRGDTDDEKGCKLGGTTPQFLGVSMRDVTQEVSNSDTYVDPLNTGILTKGDIWVQVSGTPGPDDPVHYNATTGVFAASAGSGPILGARWMTDTRNGLCKLNLSGYNQATS